jgi:hypothetical protein
MSNQVEALRRATHCVDEYRQELEKRLATLHSWYETRQVAVELVQRFPEPLAPDDYFHSPDTSVQFTLDTGTHQALIISRDCKSIGEAVEPLRFLRERLGSYKVEDNPDFNRRIYSFENNGHKVIFQCFFWNRDDQICRYVQVGTKEVPVMKLMCGEQEVEPV